jgi:hypothetical protein
MPDPDVKPARSDLRVMIRFKHQIRNKHPGSRILIFIYPGSRIQQHHKRIGKKLLSYLFCSHKFNKIENYLVLNRYRKKFERIDKELYIVLPLKNCH